MRKLNAEVCKIFFNHSIDISFMYFFLVLLFLKHTFNDLNELINENSELSKRIALKEQKEKLDENRRREVINRRHKELGLRSAPKRRGVSRVYK